MNTVSSHSRLSPPSLNIELSTVSSKEPTMEDAPIPGAVFIGMERQNIFRGKLEEPTRGDLNFEY
jgi:hypothetical protein